MNTIIFLALTNIFLIGKKDIEDKSIVNIEQITHIIDNPDFPEERSKAYNKLSQERIFWQKKNDTEDGAFIYEEKLAQVNEALFEVTGEVKYLQIADQHYTNAVNMTAGKRKAAVLLSQSSNAIKLHQFQKALKLSQRSYDYTMDNIGPSYMTFDASMELGRFDYAAGILNDFKDEDSFDYLVRYAKVQDHNGDLEGAIKSMEKALEIAQKESEDRYIWALANLGDMYGHDGQIQKSYDTYLKVLDREPNHLHVLKGIAWIAYANDGNTDAAKNILKFVSSANKLPDAYLLLAEIEEYEGNLGNKEKYTDQFLKIAEKPEYQNLYASYLIDIYLDDKSKWGKALGLAKDEVDHRPTPATYATLAKVYHVLGNVNSAESIIKNKVLGKSFEPDVVYTAGSILAEVGCYKESKILMDEALDASYELGPLTTKEIIKTQEKLTNKMSNWYFISNFVS